MQHGHGPPHALIHPWNKYISARLQDWIMDSYLHLSSPLLAPILALHGSSLAPIYHDIYGMCQTNIQQEIVS